VTELTIDPEQLTQASCKLTMVAGDMVSDAQALQSTIVGSGSPWGADDAGSVFGMLYQVVLGKALETIAGRADQVGYAAEGLAAHSEAFASTETGVKANITNAGKAI
jgi:hypothetical protein